MDIGLLLQMQCTVFFIALACRWSAHLRKKLTLGFFCFSGIVVIHRVLPFLEWFNAPFSPNPYLRRAKKFFKPND
ncbi:MAG TPA: hypothetical protein VG738_20175 [Chitinophagaceae bacterium]|nr:hypothetical protein [Chitinophagaceae bacterium]